jgi:hypothetical protein
MVRKLDSHIQKNAVHPLPDTIYRNQFKKITGLNIRIKTIKLLKGSIQAGDGSVIEFLRSMYESLDSIPRNNKKKLSLKKKKKLKGYTS